MSTFKDDMHLQYEFSTSLRLTIITVQIFIENNTENNTENKFSPDFNVFHVLIDLMPIVDRQDQPLRHFNTSLILLHRLHSSITN